jgi:hypothetical protein
MAAIEVASSLHAIDWDALRSSFFDVGYVRLRQLLSRPECEQPRALYVTDTLFRSTVEMQRYAFGAGEYRYFDYPLPEPVSTLRTMLYRSLAPWANEIAGQGRSELRYPPTLEEFLARCRSFDQHRATPLLLRYQAGDHNRLHRDRYGECQFPLQAVVMLSRPRKEFEGGEFVLVENYPRQQSRARVVGLEQGDLLIFPGTERYVEGKRGMLRVDLRHGVSEVHRGERMTLGMIFHDAA